MGLPLSKSRFSTVGPAFLWIDLGYRRLKGTRTDAVVRIAADFGAPEKGDSGAASPVSEDLLLALAEVGIILDDVGAAAEPYPGDSPERRIAAEVEHRLIGPVHMFRHLL